MIPSTLTYSYASRTLNFHQTEEMHMKFFQMSYTEEPLYVWEGRESVVVLYVGRKCLTLTVLESLAYVYVCGLYCIMIIFYLFVLFVQK